VVRASGTGLSHPRAGIAVNSLARLLSRTQRAGEADRLLKELLDDHQKRFGPDHFLVADAMMEKSYVLRDRGDVTGERRTLEEALAIYSKSDRARGRLYATCLNNCAIARLSQNKPPEAQQLLEKALPIARKQCGERHVAVGTILANLAATKLKQRNTQDVENHLREAERCGPALSFSPSPLLDDVLRSYGELYRMTRRVTEAEAVAKRRLNSFSSDPWILYQTASDFAMLLPLVEDPAVRTRLGNQAVDSLRRAIQRGWKDFNQLRTNPSLAGLQTNDEFKKLLGELEKK
jgi:tetratricopeptide (TPR) repeat protein